MNQSSSQKSIAQNIAQNITQKPGPRVHIEYDVGLPGAEKKVELPFVMGVMADLSGQSGHPLPPLAERNFLAIDIHNFDERMKAIQPRVAFLVPNTLTGDGCLAVDITFESLDDFSPGALARQVSPLAHLLETRDQLANLQTYMDGKAGAEGLLRHLLQQPQLMHALLKTPTRAPT